MLVLDDLGDYCEITLAPRGGGGKRLGNSSRGREDVQDVSEDSHPREQPEPFATRVRIPDGNHRQLHISNYWHCSVTAFSQVPADLLTEWMERSRLRESRSVQVYQRHRCRRLGSM